MENADETDLRHHDRGCSARGYRHQGGNGSGAGKRRIIRTTATYAFGLNAQGDIGGTHLNRAASHGFVVHHGVFTTIDVPRAANFTEAKGNNEAGDVVEDYVDARGNTHGFLLHHGRFTTLDVPGAINGTNAYQITTAGDIVGFYFDAGGKSNGFLLHHGAYTTIDVPSAG